jgi:hypothetical protein
MVTVLRDIALRKEIWPIEITEGASGPYLYSLHHGAHRFHASVAAGFLHIPAIILARHASIASTDHESPVLHLPAALHFDACGSIVACRPTQGSSMGTKPTRGISRVH